MEVKQTSCNKKTVFTAEVSVRRVGRTVRLYAVDDSSPGGLDIELSLGCATKLALELMNAIKEK